MADKKISELDLTLQINNDAVFPMSQDNAGEPTTFKAAITQLGTKIAEDMTFSNLQTTSKTLVGAINELLSLGSPIIIGTTAPTSSQGADGNIYVQYTEGTGGNPDTVDSIYAKIDGAWCEISTGGGSGTTDYEDLSNKPQVNSVELVGNKSLDDLGIMPASLSKTVSGSLVHITDGADNIPVKSLVSQIVASESGNGQPKSPTNPYTISGFDNGIITRCGKNIFKKQSGMQFVPLKSGTTIYGRIFGYSGQFTLYGVKKGFDPSLSANWVSLVVLSYTDTRTYTFTEDFDYIGISSGAYSDLGSGNVQVSFENYDTFTAYNGQTYNIPFGQTIYGGYFDNKGNLVVTHSIVDLGSLTWTYYQYGGLNGGYSDGIAFDIKHPTSATEVVNAISSGFVVKSDNYFDTNPAYNQLSVSIYGRIKLNIDGVSDSATLKTALSGIMLVYELANPITLAITSQDIPTLSGENNIFSNCGDVEVNYFTDKADEIVEVLKATASTPLHHYSEDEHIVGTWIDGKTLYEKTVIITNAGKDASYDLGITDFDTCFVYNGSFSGNGVIPYLHGSYPDNSIGGFLDDTGSSLAWAFRSGSQVPATISGFITVRYTKSV